MNNDKNNRQVLGRPVPSSGQTKKKVLHEMAKYLTKNIYIFKHASSEPKVTIVFILNITCLLFLTCFTI